MGRNGLLGAQWDSGRRLPDTQGIALHTAPTQEAISTHQMSPYQRPVVLDRIDRPTGHESLMSDHSSNSPGAPPTGARVPAGTRVYAIGDIHGCAAQLQALHDSIAWDAANAPPRAPWSPSTPRTNTKGR